MTTKEEILALAGEPVAYLHWERPDADVVTASVRNVWGKVTADRISKYTIPLYTSDQLLAATKLLEEEVETLTVERDLNVRQCDANQQTVVELRQQLAEKDAIIEQLRDSNIDKLLAMSDEQVTALTEGWPGTVRNPRKSDATL